MTRQEVAKLMALITVEFSGRFDVTEDRLGLWSQALQRVAYEDGKEAVVKAVIGAGQWPPTVGDVVKKLEEIFDRRRYRQLEQLEQRRLEEQKQISQHRPIEVEGPSSPGLEMLRKLIGDLNAKTKEIV